MFSFFLGLDLRVQLLADIDDALFNILRNCHAVSSVAAPFYTLTTSVEGLGFSILLPVLAVI